MLKIISELVGKRAAEFSEEKFLAFLEHKVPEISRREIVLSSTELQLIESLSEEDLIKPLKSHKFPRRKRTFYELLAVLHNTIIGTRLENLFDVYQRLYISTFFLHCYRMESSFVEVSDDAICLGLEAVLASDDNLVVQEWFKEFLFFNCKEVADWKEIDSCTYFSLLGILVVLLYQKKQESSDFHIVLEYLLFHRATYPSFIPISHSVAVVENWRSVADKALTVNENYNEVLSILLPE